MRWNFDRSIICCKCHEHPATNKKQEICSNCYLKVWKEKAHGLPLGHFNLKNLEANNINIPEVDNKVSQHKAEILFSQYHPTFAYQPVIFRLGKRYSYAPDFYDSIHDIYYEVIGSRQRFNQLKEKIRYFRKLFPCVKLIICCGDGKLYHSRNESSEFMGISQNGELFQ